MDKLEKFFENIERITTAVESLLKPTAINIKESNQTETPVMPISHMPQSVVPTTTVMAPNALPQATPVPTASQTENFSMEQIAVAMSNAQSAGKMDLIQKIFNTFGVQTLMQINPANYNQIATMLREAGIQI